MAPSTLARDFSDKCVPIFVWAAAEHIGKDGMKTIATAAMTRDDKDHERSTGSFPIVDGRSIPCHELQHEYILAPSLTKDSGKTIALSDTREGVSAFR
jgi:hypothetical protein